MKITKLLLIVTFALSMCFACKKEPVKKLAFSVINIADSVQNYTDDTTLHNVVKIGYYNVSGEPKWLADTINKDFFSWLGIIFIENRAKLDKTNLKRNIALELKRFINEMHTDSVFMECESCKSAEFRIVPKQFFQSDKIVSVVYYNKEALTSVANKDICGISAFNYDKNTGKEINIYNLSENHKELLKIAENAFVQQNGSIKKYLFSEGFFLPKTFYFTQDELVFYYHTHEISHQSTNPFKIKLKYDDIRMIVKYI